MSRVIVLGIIIVLLVSLDSMCEGAILRLFRSFVPNSIWAAL